MKIRPMNDRVLVTRVEEKQKTAGGIIIPDTAKEKPQEGKVVAVGPGKLDDRTANVFRWRSKRATGSSSPNMPEPKSKLMASNTFLCVKTIFWAS